MRTLGRIAIVCLAVIASVACLAPQNSLMTGVDMTRWCNTTTVSYNNDDSLATRNLNIALRYNDTFKDTVLPIKVGITTPDARYFEEEITLQINHPRTALTVSTTESLPYRSNVVLAQKGYYIFAFTPHTEVRGIEAIGIEFK